MYVWVSGRAHIGSVSLSVFVHLLHVSVSLTIVCFFGGGYVDANVCFGRKYGLLPITHWVSMASSKEDVS